jgi:signal transduction histidine kinase
VSATGPQSPRSLPRLRVGQWLLVTIGVLLAFAVGGIGLALSASQRLGDRRHVVVDQVEPSLRAALGLENALVNEETGIRGYAITAEPRFLDPYRSGRTAEQAAYLELARRSVAGDPRLAADIAEVRARSRAWRQGFAEPVLRRTARSRSGSLAASVRGKALFDAIRLSMADVQNELTLRLARARGELSNQANLLETTLLIAGALIIGSVLGAGLLLQRIITRPLARLREEASEVAGGDFAKPLLVTSGSVEIVELGGEMDAMRRRILQELVAVRSARELLEAQAGELQRSNAELEQFAYVASHDLQEPLRKVASFCQALERRYHGQLDERADQYIEFAVDGAKRMQTLINDLLSFSRVGRSGREQTRVDLAEVVGEARRSLSDALAETGGRVEVGDMPVVLGDRTLLGSLFTNLISNAIKFHGKEPVLVRIVARREGDRWHITCSDNGIGIESDYAERIFVIFQRLHTKESYPGTGIGLAMCRKIVEYHGGQMWLDTDHAPGASFELTLPVAEETS